MNRFKIGEWVIKDDCLVSKFIDTKSGKETLIGMHVNDVYNSSPKQLIQLVTKLVENSING